MCKFIASLTLTLFFAWQSNMGKQVMYQMSKEQYEKAERGMSQDLATTSLPHCEMGQDIIKIVNQRIEDHQAYLASKGIAPTPGPWDDPSVKPRPRRGKGGPGSSASTKGPGEYDQKAGASGEGSVVDRLSALMVSA